VAASPADKRPVFSKTIRLPRPMLIGWLAFACVWALFFGVLWATADLTSGRLVSGIALVATSVFWFVGPLWLVAMHVGVDGEAMTRRVGHRRTRIRLRDIASSRVEGRTQPDLERVILTLRDGSDHKVLTRRSAALVAALGGGPP
jgi:hypothetical protein